MPVDEILRVPYQVPGSQNWQWINIYTRLSQERINLLESAHYDGGWLILWCQPCCIWIRKNISRLTCTSTPWVTR